RNGEGQRTNLHEVPVLNLTRLGQLLAIDEGPVPTPQVLDSHDTILESELRVLSTDLLTVGAQLTGLIATDLEHGTGQRDDPSLRLPLDNDQLHNHRNRPDL